VSEPDTKTVLAFGEILWDLLPTGTTLGGAPFNFVYRVHALGNRGLMVSRVGDDENGRKAIEMVRSLGLDTSLVQVDAVHPTGTVNVFLDADNNPDYYIVPGTAYDHIEPTEALAEAAGVCDCFCFGTLVQRSPETRDTLYRLLDLAGDALKFLDINLRKDCYREETVRESLRRADVLKLNDGEARELAGMLGLPLESLTQFAHAITRQAALKYCVITLGARGALGVSGKGEEVYVPGCRVDVADTLGSGDAFSAGFVHSLLGGEGLAAACEFGNILGALVATQKGGTAPVTQADIESFRKTPRDRVVDEDVSSGG